MDQTPVHDQHNPDLLKFMPIESKRIIEIGCSSGALARAFKIFSPKTHYRGVEVDEGYAALARRYCDECLTLDIESAPPEFWTQNADRDCWVFGDTLEHLRDPWAVLRNIRAHIPKNGVVVACIPNAQHWTMQVRLAVGDFRYEDSGLLDRTHLRWFTRQTITEAFDAAGFEVKEGIGRTFDEQGRDAFLPLIEKIAEEAGVDAKVAVADAIPLQYVVRAVPK